ncbi:hypothetical protein OsI_19226 [Oryza sativa Indica Group]|uniref:Uncharacterized protein n=1 Tax=Oryza sativa subsp. indica TaxID=39946 RepID=B8B043_ORYSI|nr:hypothetical protein OsI_19226 [Oryza sativa Indica Group]
MVTPAPPTGWDFSTGDSIRDEVWSRFGSPVHFSSHFSRSTFRLVVDVPRSSFRLTSSSVALALRAAIGGSPSDLHVDPLIDRSFTFLVCSKKVGLWIYSLRSFSCKDFSVRYFLWKNGGPDWRREWDLWQAEQYNEWTIVKRRYSSGNRSQHLIKASSVFDRLKFDIPSSPKRIAQKSDSIVSKEIFLANSDPKGMEIEISLPPSPRKRGKKRTPFVDSQVRRSGRLLALRDGFKNILQEDPNMGVGKPRGKAVKKLKQLAEKIGSEMCGTSLEEVSSLVDLGEAQVIKLKTIGPSNDEA